MHRRFLLNSKSEVSSYKNTKVQQSRFIGELVNGKLLILSLFHVLRRRSQKKKLNANFQTSDF